MKTTTKWIIRALVIAIVWPQLLALIVIGLALFTIAHRRFRATLASMA